MTVIGPLALALFTVAARGDEFVESAVRMIVQHHVMHPDPASLSRDSPAALLASLRRIDPAAQWWPPDVASANREWTGDEILGIGASVIDDGMRILLVPLPGGALSRAGFSQPVRLLALSGQSADRLGLASAQQILGDPAHDPVNASVVDLTGGTPVHLVLRRSTYEATSVERLESRGMPILRIHRFIKGLTLRQFRELLEPIASTGQPIVLDLRYSVGGDLFEALDTASLFLAPGLKLATLVDAAGRRTELKSVGSGPKATAPITILIGTATISASEVFAAALHDEGNARLIGTQTFGKCLAQSTYRLIDGSVLVISTARILDAHGQYCDGKGLAPDIQVDRATVDNTDALVAKFVR